MAIDDIAVLHPEEYTVGQDSNPANVLGEFTQLVNTVNDIKDVAEDADARSTANSATSSSNSSRITTAETDIDDLQDRVTDLEGLGPGTTAVGTLVTDAAGLVLNSNPQYANFVFTETVLITVGDPDGVFDEGRVITIVALDAAAMSSDYIYPTPNSPTDYGLRKGESLTMACVTIPTVGLRWIVISSNINQTFDFIDATPADLATITGSWYGTQHYRVTRSSGTGIAYFELPEIDTEHLGKTITIWVSDPSSSTRTVRVITHGTPTNPQRFADSVSYIEMVGGDSIVLTAGPDIKPKSSTAAFTWHYTLVAA